MTVFYPDTRTSPPPPRDQSPVGHPLAAIHVITILYVARDDRHRQCACVRTPSRIGHVLRRRTTFCHLQYKKEKTFTRQNTV